MLAGNTRDEAKLFPTFLALSPALGGVSGRLVSDATLFNTQFGYNPDAAPTVTLAQWIPAVYLPVTTPVTGFNARTDLLNLVFFTASRDNVLNALKTQQTTRLVLPLRLGQGAGALERHLRRRPRVRPAVHLRHLRAVALRQHHDRHARTRRAGSTLSRRDDEEHRRVRQEQRPEQRRARRDLAGLARQAALQRQPDGQARSRSSRRRSPPAGRAAADWRRAVSPAAGGAVPSASCRGTRPRPSRAAARRSARCSRTTRGCGARPARPAAANRPTR